MRRDDGLIARDISIVGLSLFVAGLLVWLNIPAALLKEADGFGYASSFFAGSFFTSIFTTAPAIVTLGEIARADGLFETAFFGAMGAVVGDLVLFRFVRDRLTRDIVSLLRHRHLPRRLHAQLRRPGYRWLAFLVGGMIIASPLPDELGVSILGMSRMNMRLFIPISFAFNFIGILLIGVVARAIP